MASFTTTPNEQSTTGSAVVINIVAPAESSTNVDEITVATKASSVGGVTSVAAAARRPHDLGLHMPTLQQSETDFGCHQVQHQQNVSSRQAARRSLLLSSPLGLCMRHPSTPQPPGTCCFQDGRRDFDNQYQGGPLRSPLRHECHQTGAQPCSPWCCLHNAHPAVGACRRAMATFDDVRIKHDVEERYVFTMTEAERCLQSPIDDYDAGMTDPIGIRSCSCSISPSEVKADFAVNAPPRPTNSDPSFACALDVSSPVIDCHSALVTTTLGVPEIPMRRRRSVSADCSRMESIAEEIQSTSTVLTCVAKQSSVGESSSLTVAPSHEAVN